MCFLQSLPPSLSPSQQKKGKKKDDDVALAKYEHSFERHTYHTRCLEVLLRRLENDDLSVEDLEEIRDSVDYYVESNQVRGEE